MGPSSIPSLQRLVFWVCRAWRLMPVPINKSITLHELEEAKATLDRCDEVVEPSTGDKRRRGGAPPSGAPGRGAKQQRSALAGSGSAGSGSGGESGTAQHQPEETQQQPAAAAGPPAAGEEKTVAADALLQMAGAATGAIVVPAGAAAVIELGAPRREYGVYHGCLSEGSIAGAAAGVNPATVTKGPRGAAGTAARLGGCHAAADRKQVPDNAAQPSLHLPVQQHCAAARRLPLRTTTARLPVAAMASAPGQPLPLPRFCVRSRSCSKTRGALLVRRRTCGALWWPRMAMKSFCGLPFSGFRRCRRRQRLAQRFDRGRGNGGARSAGERAGLRQRGRGYGAAAVGG